MSKKSLGQFNTTRKDYILSGFEQYVGDKDWIDPFAGQGDLLSWANQHGAKSIMGYDIDSLGWEVRDTLGNPPDYKDKWIIANPPYLAKNKNKDKRLYDQYSLDDYYKIAIKTCIGCLGGIFIVPLNFLCSEGSKHIRQEFFANYGIVSCRIFEERVFDDTDYTVCAFYFDKNKSNVIPSLFLPSSKQITYSISEKYSWAIGQEFYSWLDSSDSRDYYISRYTVDNYQGDENVSCAINDPRDKSFLTKGSADIVENIMLLRAIDTGTIEGRIRLFDIREFGIDLMAGLNTSRNFAHIRVGPPALSISAQLEIISRFNAELERFRGQLNSVFLTAYRNSTCVYSRKRIGFDTAYKIVKKLILFLGN